MSLIDRSSPVVRILLFQPASPDGVVLDLGDRLVSFEYEDVERKLDKVKLVLDNEDLAFLEDDSGLMGGGHLRVSWGYRGFMSTPRDVQIKRIRGMRKLTVEGVDLGSILDRVQRSRTWEDKTHSEIAREVAEELGYTEESLFIEDTEERYEVVTQAGETDARLLRRIANLNGFEWYLDPAGFHFHERVHAQTVSHVFEWRSDKRGTVIDVNLEVDLLKRVGRTRSKSRDPEAKITNEHDAAPDTVERDGLSAATQTGAPESVLMVDAETLREYESAGVDDVHGNESSVFIGPTPDMVGKVADQQSPSYLLGAGTVRPLSISEYNLTQGELIDLRRQQVNATGTVHAESPRTARQNKKQAEARWKRAERESVKLTAQLVGDPSFQAKTVCEMLGIGSWLSGLYYVKQVTHKVTGSGYTMDAQLRGDGVNKTGAANVPKDKVALQEGDTGDRGDLREDGDQFVSGGGTIGDADLIERVDAETRTTSLERR
jgi:phage protein D